MTSYECKHTALELEREIPIITDEEACKKQAVAAAPLTVPQQIVKSIWQTHKRLRQAVESYTGNNRQHLLTA
jgi:hypothetical protein